MSKLVPIDFEFNGTAEKRLNLVCCSFQIGDADPESYWLYGEESWPAWAHLKARLKALRDDGYIFLVFSGSAEAHAFISLGLDPTKARWLDLQQEWKMLTNHYHKFMYGKQLIDGVEVFTTPPTYGVEEGVNNARAPKSLAAFLYKVMGIKIDTDHKNKMRDIIISNDSQQINAHKQEIRDYCTSDVAYLRPAWKEVAAEYKHYFRRAWRYTKAEMEELGLPFEENESIEVMRDEVLWRGETAARAALISATGYPVNVLKVKKFAASVPLIMKELCEDINEMFPVEHRFFKWNKAEQRYSVFQKPLKDWIKSSQYGGDWLQTKPSKTKPEGDISLSLEAWERHFSFRHDFPRGHVGAQVLRYLRTKQSLNGFMPKSKNAKVKETFFDYLGSDGRVRPYLNPYGAQSARFQPKATGFIPLKSAWMRSLIEPKPGFSICGFDYSSQEFLIAALVSNDKNMIKAYQSGDVYLYFAKLAGAVPWDGTKKEYKAIRDVFKSTTLGISYSMGAKALAAKLTDDTGRPHTKQDAQDLINKFMSAYPDYANWIDAIRFDYGKRLYHRLPDGWTIFGDNDNARSISNVPIQGIGSCALRKWIQLAQDAGLKVIFPNHDACYIEFPTDRLDLVDTFAACAREAFGFYFEDPKLASSLIRLDCNIWGPDLENKTYTTPGGIEAKGQTIYVDERAVEEYERFKKYWEN